MSLTSRLLFEGELVRIYEVLCQPDVLDKGPEEHSCRDTLVLPGRGRFLQHPARGGPYLAEPTQALLFPAGSAYRVSHPDPHGDECLSLTFQETVLDEVLRGAAGVEQLDDPRLRAHVHLTPAGTAARALLWRRLARRTATALEAEETALALLASVAGAARRPPAPAGRRRSSSRSQRALAVRELLLQRPDEAWRLSQVARHVYTTPFHLARLFRAEVGMPVHQYHLRVRLARALDLLLDTGQSLSAVALACGFASHSHFTAVFRRLTGVAPARLRAACSGAGVHHVRQTLLTGPTAVAGRSRATEGAE